MNRTLRAFDSYKVGERYDYARTISAENVDEFAALSGDDNALHLDEAFGQRTRFAGRVVHGALSFGFMAAAQTQLVGAGVIWLDSQVRFTAPVRIGDTITTTTEIAEIVAEKRILKLHCTARRANGEVVMEGRSTVKHLRETDARPVP